MVEFESENELLWRLVTHETNRSESVTHETDRSESGGGHAYATDFAHDVQGSLA